MQLQPKPWKDQREFPIILMATIITAKLHNKTEQKLTHCTNGFVQCYYYAIHVSYIVQYKLRSLTARL